MAILEQPMSVPGRRGTNYPKPHDAGFDGRIKRALGVPLGLTQFGVNLTTLEPGAMSALRHWHASEDEFVYVLTGDVILITDEGEQVLGPGMAAGFPAGEANGHHLVNRGGAPATYLEVGTRSATEDATYPDDDLVAEKRDGAYRFFHKDGTSYE